MAGQFPEIGILSLAMMLSMLTGGIDLSVVSVANLAAILASTALHALAPETAGGGQAGIGSLLAACLALLVGAAAGLCNGLLVARVGIAPILATLGTMSLFAGLSTVITGGTTVFGVPAFATLGSASPWGIPLPLLVFVLLAGLVSLALARTAFGHRMVLLGTNPTAARFAGIESSRVLIRTYLLSGLLSAVAGLVFLARNNAASADYGGSYVLLAVLVVILGGVDYLGGSGRVAGVVAAVLVLQILSTGLNFLLIESSGSNFFKEFAWGAVLLLVMATGRVPWKSPRPAKCDSRTDTAEEP